MVIALCACGPRKPKGVFIDPALEILVPPDTTFAAGADLDALRTTHAFQKYLSQGTPPQLAEFSKKAGIDPAKDLWQILSFSNGKDSLVLARGKFSEREQEPRAPDGVPSFNYKGVNFFGDEQTAVAFLNPTVAAAGKTALLRRLIDNRNQGEHGFSSELRAKIDTVGPANQVWAAFSGGLPETGALGKIAPLLRGVESGTLGLNLRSGAALDLHLDCQSDADARRTHDAIDALVAIGKMSKRAASSKVYEAIQVIQDQAKVQVKAQVPQDLEDPFLDLWFRAK